MLIIASYHKGYAWEDEIIDIIQHQLAGAEFEIFYMDSKNDLPGADGKAQEAFRLFEKIKPDAVITIDDNAQSFFVVPYLKDKVKTPVFFCGVNDDASKYGFPAANVTGVLEKKHYRESISFAQLIKPKIQKIAVFYRPSPSNSVNVGQIDKEMDQYTAEVAAFIPVNTVDDILKGLTEFDSKVDAYLLLNMTGVIDNNMNKLEGSDAISMISKRTDRVTIGASDWEVEAGALCGVIKSGEEQGSLVARQLLKLWSGEATIKEISVQKNINGQRFINLETLKRLEIKLEPHMVIGTKIISEK